MASSEEKGLVSERGLSTIGVMTERIQPDNALHVDYARTMINNWHHAYDSTAQVRINWIPVTTTAGTMRPSHTFAAADTYEHVMSFGPFPWELRYDGTMLRPVFRLAGAVNNAAYEVTFKAVFTLHALPIDEQFQLASAEVATSSTTETWLTFSSTYLTPAPDNAYLQGVSTISTFDFAGLFDTLRAASAEWLLARLDVYAKADDAAAVAYLSGAYLREYSP